MTVSIKRPKAIVFDILGTASKSGFLEKILFPFLKVNLDAYVATHWNKKDFLRLYNRIMDQSLEFNRQEPITPVVLPHDNQQAKASLMNFINFVTENGINSPSVTQLRFKVWFEGYQQSKIRTPIYADVPNRMRQWFAEGCKFYVFSNTWVEAQKALLKNTNHGDLTNLISGHYDNDFGSLLETESWRRFCSDIQTQPNDVLFLTKSSAEAKAASEAGITVILVLTHRHNVKAITKEDRQRFPYVRTLNDLTWLEGDMTPNSQQPLDQAHVATAVSTGTSANNQPPLVSSATQATQANMGHSTSATAANNPSGTTTATTIGTTATRAANSTSQRGGSRASATNTKTRQESSNSQSKK